jgi:hypothetical protein
VHKKRDPDRGPGCARLEIITGGSRVHSTCHGALRHAGGPNRDRDHGDGRRYRRGRPERRPRPQRVPAAAPRCSRHQRPRMRPKTFSCAKFLYRHAGVTAAYRRGFRCLKITPFAIRSARSMLVFYRPCGDRYQPIDPRGKTTTCTPQRLRRWKAAVADQRIAERYGQYICAFGMRNWQPLTSEGLRDYLSANPEKGAFPR